jgi:hypothetical protein
MDCIKVRGYALNLLFLASDNNKEEVKKNEEPMYYEYITLICILQFPQPRAKVCHVEPNRKQTQKIDETDKLHWLRFPVRITTVCLIHRSSFGESLFVILGRFIASTL